MMTKTKTLSLTTLLRIADKHDDYENQNDHANAFLLLAQRIGTPAELKLAREYKTHRDTHNGFSGDGLTLWEKGAKAHIKLIRRFNAMMQDA